MIVANFRAEADLVGRRVRVSWDFELEGIETLADIPPVTVRRKARDFEYPPVAAPDPFLVYDSAAFPPAPSPPAVVVNDPPGWQTADDGEQTTVDVVTVGTMSTPNGQAAETLRRTRSTVADAGGVPVRQRVEILDLGGSPAGLTPGRTYYYQIFSPILPSGPGFDPTPYRATATPSEQYGTNAKLYESLPAIYRRHDVVARPVTPGVDGIPEAAGRSGQLRRFIDLFGTGLDLMRGGADGLRSLQDVDNVDYRYLPLLAEWIGWKLSLSSPVPLQRNEIKSAALLYKGVGTVPALRAIVERYTGWYTQVAEMEQQIARSNLAAQRNVFAIAAAGGAWRGTDDAAPALGFGVGNDAAVGGAGTPASLLSSVAEPFALRPGMQLLLVADNNVPEAIRFGPGDFGVMGAATARDVADAITRVLPGVTATVQPGGRVQIRSNTVGAQSSLQIKPLAASPVSLDGAPGGRLAAFTDAAGRTHVFYATADAPPTTHGAAGDLTRERVQYKSFAYGRWGNSHPIDAPPGASRAAPAAVQRPVGDILAAWVDNPGTDRCTISAAVGALAPPEPARLVGQRRGPFSIPPGTRLSLRENGLTVENFAFLGGDFADPLHATPAEVVAALNARLAGVTAQVLPNNAVAIQTKTTGPTARLEIDRGNSANTQAIGLQVGGLSAVGAWDDTVAWQPPQVVAAPPLGQPARYDGLHALVDAAGVVWLFWSTFDSPSGAWQVVASTLTGAVWAPPTVLAAGGAGNVEPVAVLDAANRMRLIWSQRPAFGADDTWTLRTRLFDPVASTWGAETAVTTPPVGGRAADREPGAIAEGPLTRVYFRSDRGAGTSIWTLTVDGGGVASAPSAVTSGPQADFAPAPVRLQDGSTWLLHRSDRNVALGQAAQYPLPSAQPGPPPPPAPAGAGPLEAGRSMQTPDEAVVRRYAGTTAVTPGDLTRNALHRRWGDLAAYTPQQVMGAAVGPPLTDADLYTRGTIGLYVSRADRDVALSPANVARLGQLLDDFLPINLRAVVVLAPSVDVELVYTPGADIGESYLDDYPFADVYAGPTDSAAAALPDQSLLKSNTLGDVSVNPADITTLRRRTYGPPPA